MLKKNAIRKKTHTRTHILYHAHAQTQTKDPDPQGENKLSTHLPRHHDHAIARQDERRVLRLRKVVLDYRCRQLEQLASMTKTNKSTTTTTTTHETCYVTDPKPPPVSCHLYSRTVLQLLVGLRNGQQWRRRRGSKRTSACAHMHPLSLTFIMDSYVWF